MFNTRIDNRDIVQLERKLKAFAERGIPYATKQTLNDTAFDARNVARANIENKLINRNRWTVGSVRVDKAQGLTVRNQVAKMGSTADYMEDQEFGGRKETSATPTSYAAGQAPTAKPRTRMVRRSNRMGALQLAYDRSRGVNRKQKNLLAVKSGAKVVYLDLGRRRGIFRITGGKRNPRVRMVQSLGHRGARIEAAPTIGPAFEESLQRLPAYYADALRFQLRRQGLL